MSTEQGASDSSLSEDDARERLSDLPDWSVSRGAVVKQYDLPSFQAAIDFVHDVARLAENANHHPDIDIRYNKVTISLVTHSAGGITNKDLDMARQIETECSPPS
jgi:4a-hydroxytetrahydrobiopterin dehydratase